MAATKKTAAKKRPSAKKTARRSAPRDRSKDALHHPGHAHPVLEFLSDEAKALLFVIFALACLMLLLLIATLLLR